MLALNSLRVHSASVNGHEGSAINTFVVSPHFGSPPAAELLRQQLILALDGELDVLASLDSRDREAAQHGTTRAGEACRRGAHQPRHGAAPDPVVRRRGARASWWCRSGPPTARGLLARLTAVFERDGVDIAWAKVTTLGSSVVDVFGITAVGDCADSAGVPAQIGAAVRDEIEARPIRGATHPAACEAGVRGQLGWRACLNPCPTG